MKIITVILLSILSLNAQNLYVKDKRITNDFPRSVTMGFKDVPFKITFKVCEWVRETNEWRIDSRESLSPFRNYLNGDTRYPNRTEQSALVVSNLYCLIIYADHTNKVRIESMNLGEVKKQVIERAEVIKEETTPVITYFKSFNHLTNLVIK